MSVLKEWECKKHGHFESSHPICPSMGCRSDSVQRVFLTPVGLKSDFVRRHEKGIQKLAESYGQSNFRTAKAGESSKARPVGQELLWGSDVKKTLGMDMQQLTQATAQPFTVTKGDGSRETVPHGMRLAATELGITSKVLPPAGELTVSRHEPKMKAVLPAKAA